MAIRAVSSLNEIIICCPLAPGINFDRGLPVLMSTWNSYPLD